MASAVGCVPTVLGVTMPLAEMLLPQKTSITEV